jgi:hypothetical protein
VSLTQWTHGYAKINCSAANSSYGINLISGSHFKMGFGGTHRNNNFQVW